MASSNSSCAELTNLPLVCICIPTYNAANTIRETLASILSQSYPNLVVHISDNASTDDTLKIIESIVDKRITIHPCDVNIGAEGNFTRCIQLATGKYTAIFHGDDIYEPDILANQVAFLEANLEIGAVFTEAITIDEAGKAFGIIGCVPNNKENVARLDFQELLQTMLLHHNFLVCPSVMVRSEIYRNDIKAWGGHEFRSASDVDVWLRLAKKNIAVLCEPLMRYRISREQYSHSIRARTERADFYLVMDYYLAKPEVRSFLTKNDLQHYAWLERHERVARAINLFAAERTYEARDLLKGLFCWDSIYAAMRTRRGLVTLAGGSLLRLLIFLGVSRNAMAIVTMIKKIQWR